MPHLTGCGRTNDGVIQVQADLREYRCGQPGDPLLDVIRLPGASAAVVGEFDGEDQALLVL